MISYIQNKNELQVTIPVQGIQELYRYQKGLLGVLAEIQISGCDEKLKENLKSVYQLLSHLLLDTEFLNQHEFLVKEYRELIVKCADGKVKEI